MKLDKETVVKHQFWFLLGSYLLVWFIAVLWLKMAAGGPIETAQKKYKTANDTLTSAKQNPINTSKVLPPWKKQAGEFDGWKTDIWNKAWNLQGGMYDWPEYLAKTKDMTTPQTELTDDERSHYRDKYKAEVDQLRGYIPRLLDPIELQGGFDRIFQPMEWKETPTREEMWLVQEDFWVKRELFYVVWKVMAEQAFMPAVPIDETKEPLPKEVKARYRYRNQNWELTLNIRESKEGLVVGGDSTIKNVHPSLRTQTLTSAKGEGIIFLLSQKPNLPPIRFEVRGEPVPPGEPRALGMEKDKPREDYGILDGIDWSATKTPVYVSQAFDVTNCPIRRIEQIALAKQDCRTYTWPLQSNQALAQLDAAPEDPNAKKPEAAPAGGGGMMGGGAMGGAAMAGQPAGGQMGGRNPAGPGGEGAAVDADNRTPNNEIDRNRYLRPATQDKAVNPPSRHLPLAIRLVVEQSHLHDVQVAMANSRLRLQITQVEAHHAKDFKPQGEDDKKGSPDRAGRGGMFMAAGMPNMDGMNRNSPRPGMGGAMPGSMPGGRNPGMRSGRGSGGRRPSGVLNGSPPPMMAPPSASGSGRGMPIAMLPSMRGRNPLAPAGQKGDVKPSASKPPDDNLIEVTIYAYAALYRRPDPPKTEQSAATGAQQPVGTQQPATAPTTSDKPVQPGGKQPTTEMPTQPAEKKADPKSDAKTPTTPKNEKR